MNIWQIIAVFYWGGEFLYHLMHHGEPKVNVDGSPEQYNVYLMYVEIILQFIVLYCGGFFG